MCRALGGDSVSVYTVYTVYTGVCIYTILGDFGVYTVFCIYTILSDFGGVYTVLFRIFLAVYTVIWGFGGILEQNRKSKGIRI